MIEAKHNHWNWDQRHRSTIKAFDTLECLEPVGSPSTKVTT